MATPSRAAVPGAPPQTPGAQHVAVAEPECLTPPGDPALATQIGATRSLALRRLAAAATGRTDRFPDAAAPGATTWTRRPASAWTAGFYPASLWQAFEWTRDPVWLRRARTWTSALRSQATNSGTHDLGFVLDTTAGRGARLDPSRAARTSYAATVVTAARTLASRWDPDVGAVRSRTYGGRWGVIIDSGMNMELLFHAARLTSSPAEAQRFRTIAHEHLLTLVRDFVRPDGSTFHRMVYDADSGELLGPVPGQGHATTSTWSRGQAWAVYGLAAGYRETGDARLLDAARAVAAFWMSRISADCVPLWDFAAPADLPQKDSSAGAIGAAGLLELVAVDADPLRQSAYRAHALSMLARLTARPYTTEGSAHPAVLRRQSYSIPANAAEGAYIWGDHYLLDAMTRALPVLRFPPRLQVSAPTTAAYGSRRTVDVRAMLPGGAPAAALPVTLQWRARGTHSWVPVAAGTSGVDGRAALRFRPYGSGSLRIVSSATGRTPTARGGFDPATSDARALVATVRGRLRVSVAGSTTYVLYIPRTAAPPRTRFALQERRAGRWTTVRTATSLPATSARQRGPDARYFRILPVVPRGVRALPSAVVRIPSR